MLPDFSQCRPQDAYAAGIIDGEGWIGIGRFSKSALPTFQPKVEVAMSEKALAVIRWLKAEYGGNVYKKPDSARPENAPCYRWSIVGEPAAIFLKKISPALLLKLDQAAVVGRLMRVMGPKPTGRRTWTSQMSEEAQSLYEEMKRLNRRGPMQEMSWATDQRQLDGSLETFSGTWPRAGMLVSGKLYQQPTLARPIGASASGSSVSMNWPTATASDAHTDNLASTQQSAGSMHSVTLPQAVTRDWLTPTEQDSANTGGPSQFERNTLPLNTAVIAYSGPPPVASGPPDPVSGSTGGKVRAPSTGKLNPAWVEMLQGLPMGWTQLPYKFVKPRKR